MIPVNLTAVLISSLAAMVVGFIWYSKAVFGSRWMKLSGVSGGKMDQASMIKMFGLTFLGTLVIGYTLSIFMHYAGARTPLLGAKTGLWAGLGFLIPTTLSNALFAKKSMEQYFIEVGNHVVSLVVMGAILGAWF